MGGASRNEKRRRQEAADRRLAAAIVTTPKRSRTPLIVVAVVVVVAVIVGVTLLLTRQSEDEVAPAYSASRSGAVVTAGSGPVAIDVYEDYLCPQCERFEERYGNELTAALNANQVTVRFHATSILDERTTPPGYSTRAANAALCSAEAAIFPRYHTKLFDSQPAEGSAGLSDDQLVAFGTELGAQGGFAECVRGGTHADAVAAETEAAATTPALLTDGNFGTPTVAVAGVKVDLNDTGWLADAIARG